MNLFQILTSITYLKFCTSLYEYKCPMALSWRIRGKTLCKSSTKYSCLHDENRDTLREICREMPSLLVPGNKYVIRGNLDGEECKGYRYQPFIFKTNQSSDCAFLKSRCSEIGQLTYSNGSTTDDRSCRCDYSKSYAPIHKPSNSCYCMPSVEDCSCHLKLCPDRTHLSSEYVCVSDYTLIKPDVCGPIKLSKSGFPNTIMTIEGNIDNEKFNEDRANPLLMVARFIALAALCLATVLLIFSGMELFSDVQSLSTSISKKNLFDDSNISKELDDDVIQTPPTPDQITKTVTSVDGINNLENQIQTQPTPDQVTKAVSSIDGINKLDDDVIQTLPTPDQITKTVISVDGINNLENQIQTQPTPDQVTKAVSSIDGINKLDDDVIQTLPTPDQITKTVISVDGINNLENQIQNQPTPDQVTKAVSSLDGIIKIEDEIQTPSTPDQITKKVFSLDGINKLEEEIQTLPTTVQITKTVSSFDGINKLEDETKTPPTLDHIKKTTSSFDGIKKFEDETKTPPTLDHIKKTTSSFDGIKKFEDGTQTPPTPNQIKKTGSSFDGIKKYEDDTLSSPTPDQKTEVASSTDGIRNRGIHSTSISKSDDSKNEKKPDNLKMAEDISSSNTAQFPLDPKKADILKTNHDFLVDEVRIVVIGKTGVGKSATANSIIGEPYFTSRPGAASVTVNCEKKVVNILGKKVSIVDTPGIFDTRVNSETLELEIRKCIAMTLPGPHAVLFVLNLNDRYTDNDYNVFKYFLDNFGEKILNYGIVVFTNADAIQRVNLGLDSFLENSPGNLKEVLNFFGNRKIAFNNIDETQAINQVHYLITMIDALKQGNHNDPYYEDNNFRKIDELLKKVIQGEEKHRRTEEQLDKANLKIKKLTEYCRSRDEDLKALKLEKPTKSAAKNLPHSENYCEKEDKQDIKAAQK